MANTPNYQLYKPNRADVDKEVDTTLAANFTTIDTELKANKDGLDTHKNNINAHTSENITHADGSVKTTLDNHEQQLADLQGDTTSLDTRVTSAEGTIGTLTTDVSSLQTDTTDIDSRLTEIEVLGIDKLAPNLEGRITTLESDVEGVLAPGTFDALNAQNYNFDQMRIGYVENRVGPIETQLAQIVTVDIKSKGAKSDGTDSRIVIQQAIDEVGQNGGGTVWIPKGIFDITLDSNHIGLKINYSNVKLTGEGTIRLKSGQLSGTINYSPIMIVVDTITSNETDTLENVSIENITIDQNRENNFCKYVGYSADALTVRHCISPVINNVKFKDIVDSAIMFTSNKRGRITNNRIETGYRYCKVSTTSGSTTITSTTANFTQKDIGKYIAIKKAGLDGSTVFGTTIASVIDGNTATVNILNVPIDVTVVDADALICNSDSGVYVSDYWLTSSDSPLPFSSENSRGDRTEDLIITGNRIYGFAGGFHCNRGTTRMIISNNTVHHCHFGLDLSFETVNFTAIPQKNIVSNNAFESCYRFGIGLGNAHFCIITNNRLLDTTIGIDTAGSSYCTISDNIIMGDLSPSSFHIGISMSRGFKDGVETYASYNTVEGNVLSKFWFGISEQSGCTGNVYGNNQLKGNRSDTNTGSLYVLNSTLYCLDGVWYCDTLTGKVFPILKGTQVLEGTKLRVYDGTNFRTISNYKSATNTANSATISALDATFIMLNNYSSATNVTTISNGEAGQELTLYMTNANVTFVHDSTKIRLLGKVNYTAPAQTAMKFVCIDGTIWAEVSRTS